MEEDERVDKTLDYAGMLQFSRIKREHYLRHLAPLTAFDASLNNTYAADWLTAMDELEAVPSDETIGDEIEQLTLDIKTQLAVAMRALDDLEYFVKRAFPGDKRMLRVFGFVAIRKQQHTGIARCAISMLVTAGLAEQFNAELTAAGMPPTVIPNMIDQIKELLVKEAAQEFGKRYRLYTTGLRFRAFNLLYGFFTRVRDAARIVFNAEPAVQKVFEKD